VRAISVADNSIISVTIEERRKFLSRAATATLACDNRRR